MEAHAVLLVDALHRAADVLAEHAREGHGLRTDHVHLQPALAEGGRRFQADEARADDHGAPRPRRPLDDGPALRERAQDMHVRTIRPGDGETPRLGAGGQQEGAIGEGSSTLEGDGVAGGIDARGGIVGDEGDVLLGVELGRAEGDPLLRRLAGQVVLGQVRAIHRAGGLGRHEGDGTGIPGAPQCLRGGGAGGTAAHDHDGAGRPRRHARRRRHLSLGADAHTPVRAPHVPAGDRVEGGGADGFAGAKAQARVMPRTAHRVPDHEPLGERAAVVRAGRAGGEDLLAPAHEQHRFTLGMADEGSPVAQVVPGDTRLEIRTRQLVPAAHVEPP